MSALNHRRQRGLVVGLRVEYLAALAALPFAALLGLFVAAGHGPRVLALLAGLAVVTLSYLRPMAGVLIALAGTCTIIAYGRLPNVSIGSIDLRVTDVAILAAASGAFVHRGRIRVALEGRLAFASLLGFAVLATFASVAAYSADRVTALDGPQMLRPFIYLSIAVVVAVAAGDERRLHRFLDCCLALAALAAIVSCLAAVFGPIAEFVNRLSPAAASVASDTGEIQGGALRVRLPGLSLCYMLILPTLTLLVFRPSERRWYRAIAAALMLCAIAVSFNRNQLLGLLVGLAAVVVLTPAAERARLATRAILALGLLIVVVSAGLTVAGASASVQARLRTLLDPATVLQSASLGDRERENRAAISAIARHPVLGLGPRADYGAYRVRRGSLSREPRTFVHNQYLQQAVFFGLPAALLLFAAPLLLIAATAKRRNVLSIAASDRILAAAASGSVVALLASSLVAIYFSLPSDLAAVGVCLGLQARLLTEGS